MRHYRRRVISKLTPAVVRIRTNHRDRLQILAKGKKTLFVLEQNDAFLCGLQGEIPMLLGIYDLLGISNIRVGMIEEPQTELEFQYASKCAVYQRLRDRALLDTFNEGSHVGWFVCNIHVDARSEGHCSGLLLVLGNI